MERYTSHWGGTHIFEEYLKSQNIKHRYTKVRCPWTNGYAERFNRTLLEEFYQPALLRRIMQVLLNFRMILTSIYTFTIFKEHIKVIDLKVKNLVKNYLL